MTYTTDQAIALAKECGFGDIDEFDYPNITALCNKVREGE